MSAFELAPDPRPVAMRGRLAGIASSHTLRCDAKQLERRFRGFDAFMATVPHFRLGQFLPKSFVKGKQPRYLETLDPSGIPVISTLVIQDLEILVDLCRYITEEDFEALEPERKPSKGDVLLTVDGGTSIGKPVVFDLEGDFAIDSHVAILRPEGISPQWLAYLLASPIGQLQFLRAESGASGQTGVTEDDVRRFKFPVVAEKEVARLVALVNGERAAARKLIEEARHREEAGWKAVTDVMIPPK